MDCPNRLWEHVARIFIRPSKPAQREGLARRPPCNDIYLAYRCKVESPHISLMYECWIEVFAKTFTCPFVELNKCTMFKACEFKSLGKTTTSAKKFKAPHLNPII